MNKYLADREAEKQHWLQVGQEIGWQQMSDYLTIALRDPNIMGKSIFSGERIFKVLSRVNELVSEYAVAFTDNVMADYMQEQLDAHMRDAFHEKAQPFRERYLMVLPTNYEKPKKKWTK